MRCLLAGAVLLALVLAMASAAGQGDVPWEAQAGFAVAIPPGWLLARDLPGQGLALQPPDPDEPVVELAVWRASVGVDTPAEVAREHERVLGMRLRYRRVRDEPIRTVGAGHGVYVEGLVSPESGDETASEFAAFYSGGNAYVLGTFCPPADCLSVRREVLMPAVEGLQLREPSPGPGQAVARTDESNAGQSTPVGTQPAGGEASHGTGEVTATGVHPSAPSSQGSIRYVHPGGFALSLHEGWTCCVEGPVIRVTSPNGTMGFIEPLVRSGTRPGSLAAVDLATQCVATIEGARVVGWAQEAEGGASLLRADIEVGGRAANGVFQLADDGSSAMLSGVVGEGNALRREATEAASIVASFEPRLSLPADAPGATEAWTDPSRCLSCERPAGWHLDGGIETYDRKGVIRLSGESEDGAWFVWAQPVRPIFRELTESMRRLGFRDGDPYYAYDGVDPRLVLSRGSVADHVLGFLVPRAMPGVGDEPLLLGETPLPDASLLDDKGAESALVEVTGSVAGNQTYAWCVVSQGATGGSGNWWFWETACIAFGGRAGHASEAACALQGVVESATLSGTSISDLAALVSRTARVIHAEFWAELVGDVVLRPALTDDAAEGPEAFIVPPATQGLWAAVAQGEPILTAQGGPSDTDRRDAADVTREGE